MIVIASAAYVGYELAAEFGAIPPSMLPLANKPLYVRQVNVLRDKFPKERLVLSLPRSYELSTGNLNLLTELGIQLIDVPDNLTLAESLLFVLNTVGDDDAQLRILHGDTLIDDLPTANDVLAVAHAQIDYSWEIEVNDTQEEIVWCGYFSFSSPKIFTRYLALAGDDFVAAVRNYDKQLRLNRHHTQNWFDLGHINTYFASRSSITTERSFNALDIENGLVYKSSTDNKKIEAETHWYLNVPTKIKLRTPQLIDYNINDNGSYYVLEYLNLIPLNELFVHGRNSLFFWNRILSHCDQFFHNCIEATLTLNQKKIALDIFEDKHHLINEKTWVRLKTFAEQTGISLDKPWCLNDCWLPSLNDIATQCIFTALEQTTVTSVMHGDFCFSNILFDSRGDAIKVVDPRGITHDGKFTIYGDITYDVAKLMHSIVGLYDFIVAGMYRLELIKTDHLIFEIFTDKRTIEVQNLFLNRSFADGRLQPIKIKSHVILLFLSMLPLHADDPRRQLALMANALRLYADFDKNL